jgi:hypothetical protein
LRNINLAIIKAADILESIPDFCAFPLPILRNIHNKLNKSFQLDILVHPGIHSTAQMSDGNFDLPFPSKFLAPIENQNHLALDPCSQSMSSEGGGPLKMIGAFNMED